jgi:hypothetical protein
MFLRHEGHGQNHIHIHTVYTHAPRCIGTAIKTCYSYPNNRQEIGCYDDASTQVSYTPPKSPSLWPVDPGSHAQHSPQKIALACAYYIFAPCFFLASRSRSLNNLLRIFPLGLFGITSMNSTPPANHLWRALFFSTNFTMSRRTSASESSMPTEEAFTTYAFGTSPARSSGMGITAQSATEGWSRRKASSSAGATWRPCLGH